MFLKSSPKLDALKGRGSKTLPDKVEPSSVAK